MSIQCTKVKPNGQQCKMRTLKGPFCWIHAQQYGVRVKPSGIHNLGLFATKTYRVNEAIDEYKGDILEIPIDDVPANKDYVFTITDNYHVDGENPNSSFARYINDSRGTNLRPNTKWAVDRRNKVVRVRAKRHSNGTKANPVELLIKYGRQYWTAARNRAKEANDEEDED